MVDYYNIDVVYYPCPQSGPTWRPMAIEEGGKKQFPYMRDPNKAGTAMYESNDIIKYIVRTDVYRAASADAAVAFLLSSMHEACMLHTLMECLASLSLRGIAKTASLWLVHPSCCLFHLRQG